MFRRRPELLFFLPLIMVAVGLPILLTKTVGGDHDQWSLGCFFLALFVTRLLIPFISRLEVDAELADYNRRLKPVQQLVDDCWLMVEKKELDYRRRFVQQILHNLKVVAKPDSPLPTGTKVDAYMEFGDEDWYITI